MATSGVTMLVLIPTATAEGLGATEDIAITVNDDIKPSNRPTRPTSSGMATTKPTAAPVVFPLPARTSTAVNTNENRAETGSRIAYRHPRLETNHTKKLCDRLP